jgi:hypothetical protein
MRNTNSAHEYIILSIKESTYTISVNIYMYLHPVYALGKIARLPGHSQDLPGVPYNQMCPERLSKPTETCINVLMRMSDWKEGQLDLGEQAELK